MVRRPHALVATILALGQVVAAEMPETWTATVFLGMRHLEDGPWQEVETPVQLGAMAGWRAWAGPEELVLGIAQAKGAGISREAADGTATLPILGTTARQPTRGQVEFTAWEFQVGLRRRWQASGWECSVAGGPEAIQVGVERTPGVTIVQSVSTLTSPVASRRGSVWAPGAWVAVGGARRLGGGYLGIEGRYTLARGTILEEPADFGGWQLGATVAMSW